MADAGSPPPPGLDAVFAPVVSRSAFEEALERIGTAIKLGLLPPGSQLPPERELCDRLGISRSTLRQALTALGQSGLLRAQRGRGGGTFVAERPPPATPPAEDGPARWQEACDERLAVELGVVALAAERADDAHLAQLEALVAEMDDALDDFSAYRHLDVRFHITLAEAAGSARLLALATEAQGRMTDVIAWIAHPPEVLAHANDQHARLVRVLRRRDPERATALALDHLEGTRHVLAGLLP